MINSYVLRRLLGLIPVIVGVSILVFIVMRALPGDVATMILSGAGEDRSARVNPADVEALRVQLGLNTPLIQQYFEWIWGLLRLDAGTSLWSNRPVMEELADRLPLTLELAFLSLGISMLVAIPVGIISALRQNTWLDYLFRTITIAGLAIPNFWLGTLVLLSLTMFFDWLPPLGYVSFAADPLTNIQQLIWPALIIGFSNASVIARMTRSSMLEVMREDYVRTAWAKGLGIRTILSVHALKNALLPVLTLVGIELGHLLSGTVVMEMIFTLPGVGRYLISSIFSRDYPVVQTVILLIAILFVLLNFIVDMLYASLDPRIRYK